ncbi:DUF1593 domain-containing protein [Solirubrobacter sp. CPCC 204708]|uniref:DUF1593 domain-containing protein n=1 Tax=Solirubrobacter deserti TaxID=2282478 RepID=A0ABT4RJT4_9ACTN|nr:DUF1593 domain-containing protein [Solirubrobacter deserti]MBE2315847.1 DUF1593 domain-containing protein [Solirubrobacter deserti]MDA0138817.1 DUF1593 domain-containing protein [Solirubrobacter deserti]
MSKLAKVLMLALALVLVGTAGAADAKPRAVILLDPELDDQNTLIRYLLYATDFDTQGILYQSSGVHWAGDGKGTLWAVPGREYASRNLCPCTSWRWKQGERFIEEAVDIYEQVYPNLRVHHPDYPTPASLRSKILNGNIEFDTDISKDTPGSNKIKELLLDDVPGPLYLLTGAGHSSIARALKSIKQQYEGTPEWPAIYTKVSRKAKIQSWGDQDNTYATYIRPNFPEIFYRNMSAGVWGYGARNSILPADRYLLEPAWMQNWVSKVGPFGPFYRVWGDGKQMVAGDIFDYFGERGLTAAELTAKGYAVWTPPQAPDAWISEGDTPIFMNNLDNGLRADEDHSYGGWGGRNAQDVNPATGAPTNAYAAARWFNAAQQDFAARMQWTVKASYADANHRPVVSVNGPLNVTAAPGETVRLSGTASDPDGDALTYRWWQYTDADTYTGAVALTTPETLSTSFEVPANSVVPPNAVPGQTIHLILEVTDDGAPALKAYQRVIVTVSARATQYPTATVAPVLSLSLGTAPNLGALVPGTARAYTGTSTATVTSTAGEATLSVQDLAPVNAGRLVNGAHALTAPLQVNGGDLATTPLALKTYSGPVTADATTLTYTQNLLATDTLRTGSYSKALTFTLSTTTP